MSNPDALAPGFLDALFLRGYYKRLDRLLLLECPELHVTLANAVQPAARQLIEEQRNLVVDKASKSHLVLTSTILATYRALRADERTSASALQWVTDLFVDTGKGTSKLGARLIPYLVRDPFRLMVNISKTKQLAYYGQSFDYELAEDTDDAFVLKVHRCFYHSYFVRNGAPELGAMFCLKDNNWADALDPSKVGFRFDRPTTLARGGSCCQFEFRRIASPAKVEQLNSGHP